MSLSRLALRLAAVEAIRPSAAVLANQPLPTIAGKLVFDSRIDPIDDLSTREQWPVIVVYTEEDHAQGGQASGGPEFKRIIDLLFELSIVVRASGDQPGTFTAGTPATDSELESALDLMEAQILFALMYGPSGKIWRAITGRRVPEYTSLPHRTSEEGVRLAMRSLRMKVQVDDEKFIVVPDAPLTGIDRLAGPLADVYAALAATSYGQGVVLGLSNDVPTGAVRVPLKTVNFTFQTGSPPAPQDANATEVFGSADNLDA